MADFIHIKVHQHGTETKRDHQAMALTNGELNTKLPMAVDKVGHPLRVVATEATEPDCKRALDLVASLDASCVLADKAYNSDEIIFSLSSRGTIPIIPPKINRKSQRSYDKISTKNTPSLKNSFLKMKEWRSLSTRYLKNILSFVSAFHVRSLSLFAA